MSEGDGGPGGPREGGKEDVLASIRRIVDEESRPRDRRDGVLTLTPEMRVAEGRAAPPPPAEDEDPPLTLTEAMRVRAGGSGVSEVALDVPAWGDDSAEARAAGHDDAGRDAEVDAEAGDEDAVRRADGDEDAGHGAAEVDSVERLSLRRPTPAPGAAARPVESRFGASSPADVRRAFASETPQRAGAAEDDDALRDLIRRTIREELSGEMGARVSANIRLLVEREVRKAVEALAAEGEEGDAPENGPKG